MKTIVASAYEFGEHQFGTIGAHVIVLNPGDAGKILSVQKQIQNMPSSLVYVAVRANNHPLDYLKKNLEDVVGEEVAEAFYNSNMPYIIIDGDPFEISRGTLNTDLILVFPDDIYSRYEDSESESLQKAIEEIARLEGWSWQSDEISINITISEEQVKNAVHLRMSDSSDLRGFMEYLSKHLQKALEQHIEDEITYMLDFYFSEVIRQKGGGKL